MPGLSSAAADLNTELQEAPTLLPLLKLLLLKGQRYDLEDHFTMEPMFSLQVPKQQVWCCGRQVTKSTSLASSTILRSISVPYLKTLIVLPREKQVSRLSNRNFRPFLEASPALHSLHNNRCDHSVYYKTFTNFSSISLEFAYMTVDRLRGIDADILGVDEAQDMDYDFLPIIRECMSHSRLGVSIYTGTPKTLENGIQAMWENSSQAEWIIPCDAGHWNIPNTRHDLNNMIGDDTLVCAKCKTALNAGKGHWHHFYADRAGSFPGYHVPQPILPLHYRDPEKWNELKRKRDGADNYTPARFQNEVLGESCDTGRRLISITDIQKASILPINDWARTLTYVENYPFRVLAVDWGGGGEEGTSFTGVALVCQHPTGRIDVPYVKRLSPMIPHHEEAALLLRMFRECKAHFFAHDYGGAGSVRETIMLQAGLPLERIVPFVYTVASEKNMITFKPPTEITPRTYYSLDKPRSLLMQASSMKLGQIALPEFRSAKEETKDFLALYEHRSERMMGRDLVLIMRQPKLSDDIAHAVNFGCCTIWHRTRTYPDIAKLSAAALNRDQILAMPAPPIPRDKIV